MKVIGYGLTLSNLSAGASVLLQEKGMGGRRHMGCGLFLPTRLRVGVGSWQRGEQGMVSPA